MLPGILLAVVAALPCEYVVDCSTAEQAIKVKAKLLFRCVSQDGRVGEAEITIGLNPTGQLESFTLRGVLDNWEWRYQKVDNTVFVIRGSKVSTVKSVEFDGDVWTPTVTRRFVLPPSPTPREKK